MRRKMKNEALFYFGGEPKSELAPKMKRTGLKIIKTRDPSTRNQYDREELKSNFVGESSSRQPPFSVDRASVVSITFFLSQHTALSQPNLSTTTTQTTSKDRLQESLFGLQYIPHTIAPSPPPHESSHQDT